MVGEAGFEPACTRHMILSHACIPIPPHPRVVPQVGVEPTRLAAPDLESGVSAISPLRHDEDHPPETTSATL